MRTLANCMTWAGKDNNLKCRNIQHVSAIKAALSLTDAAFLADYREFHSPSRLTSELHSYCRLWDLHKTPRLIEIAGITTSLHTKRAFRAPKELEALTDFCIVPTAAREHYFKLQHGADSPQKIMNLVDIGLQVMFNHNIFKHWLLDTIDIEGATVENPEFKSGSAYVKNQIATEFSLNMAKIRKNNLSLFWSNIGHKHADIMGSIKDYPKAHIQKKPKKKYVALIIHTMFPHRKLFRACYPEAVGSFTEAHVQKIRDCMAELESLGFSYSIATKVGIYLAKSIHFTHPPTEKSYLGEKSMKAYRIPRPYFYYKRF